MGVAIMLRALSISGMGFLFLAISPKLRGEVWGVIGDGVTAMETHAPYSYIVGVIMVLVTIVVAFNRGARAR